MIPSEEIIVFLTRLWNEEPLTLDEERQLESWRALPGAAETEEALYKTWLAAESYPHTYSVNTEQGWAKLKSRIQANTPADTQKPWTINPRRRWMRLAMAAAFLGAGLFAWWSRPQPEKFSIRTVAATTTAPMEIALPDGSLVVLQSGSSLSWPEPFEEAPLREVSLSGQAYFKVKSNASKPFRVKSDYAYAEVLGTSFNVSASPGGGGMEVTVEEGKVRLTGKTQSVILEAGQRGLFRMDGEIITKSDEDINALSWLRGEIKFRDTPLAEVLDAINRHYGVHIALPTRELERCSYTGRFSGVTLEEVIATIELTFGGKVAMTSAGKYILRGGSCGR